jgi:hypothetical protein
MGELLSASAVLMCPHGGTVSAIPSSSKVTLGGDPIVLATDTFTVAGCAFTLPAAVPSPCLLVQWQSPATKCTSDGTPLLTTDSVGMCLAATGATQGTVLIQSTQTKASGT